MKKILFFILLFFICITKVYATDLSPNSKSSILMNYETGTIVYEKNSNEALAPASMTKIMTLLLIMEQIDNNKLSLDDEVLISEKAASMGGSQIFLEANSTIKVEELIKGISIASGNDAAVAMAERIGGSLDNFVKMMNDKCKVLGCTNTNFKNVHGLDEEGHYSSAHDMALIARELIKHKDILKYTSTYEEYLNKKDGTKIWLVNTNKLVRFSPGIDGLKTGYTSNAGYCLTATGFRNNIRFISVVMGVENTNKRSQDTTDLLNYGFNNYKINKVIETDNDVGEINIDKGNKDKIKLKVTQDISELIKVSEEEKKYEYVIDVPKTIKAPVKKEDIIGTININYNGNTVYTVDVTPSEDVNKSSLFSLFLDCLKIVLCSKK